ncbi:MAG: hypothetical protein VYA86_05265 [Candidatus Thermoplasmatota archaeon]|nr:hypothetical protein [Candidatus Thermoplasmatota archaeon]
MELGGTLTAWLLPMLCLLSAIAIEWKWKYPHVHVADFFRADPFNSGITACCAAIFVIPLGWMVAIPAGAIGLGVRAISSEDSRGMWPQRWKGRCGLTVAIVLGVLLSGYGGVSEPIGAPEWGTPLSTENDEAPPWPASEQHIWMDGSTIVVANNVRLPGTLSAIGSASMILWYLETSGTDEQRLKQAIEQLDGIGFRSEWFTLETTASGLSHNYNGENLPYTIKKIEIDGNKIAEMVTIATGIWGGEVRLLTIIKPIDLISDFLPFESDPYASDYVIPWLEAQ